MTSPNHTEPTRDHQGRDIPEIYELYFHNSIIDILLDSKFKIATIFASFGAMFMGMNYFSRVQKIKAQNAMIARVGFSVIGFVSFYWFFWVVCAGFLFEGKLRNFVFVRIFVVERKLRIFDL
eukprot:TRINITY_DN2904_c0_g1_i1.p1 TRINITY_DN2904_c0_g1~~TRINITY_DN2904_c0_g1_i1.p1  ORF type:complete len:122 (-),score=18.24 TRINITY_DN2904_c0_g1_i1:341-706(-)